MPRIPDSVADGVAFLYPRREEAEAHAKIGGTCFFIGHRVVVDGRPMPGYVPYAVSNRHVVWSGGCPVIRVNRRDGGEPEIIELECDEWIVHPGGDDVAITPLLGHSEQERQKISFIGTDKLITPAFVERVKLGIGDEVLMPGRLINHQGRRENRPVVRFGSISMMPEPMWNRALNRDQESFAVEMRSRTGFSGSPVAVYRTLATTLAPVPVAEFFGLLGVNWGYINDEDGENTWLNGVVPAWKILETLEVEALKKAQKRGEDDWREALAKSEKDGGPVPAVAGVLPADENPNHQGDFTSLLNAAARKPKQDD